MNKEKNLDYKLSFPSHISIVNIRNMKALIKVLDKLPDEFVYTDIATISDYSVKNITAISRILTYLRYLGILIKIKRNKTFVFCLTEIGEELKRIVINQPEKFNEKWSGALRNSELYKSLINIQEFQELGYISNSALKKIIVNSFSKKVKNQDERYDKAKQFLIQLLKDANLFYFDGNCLRLMGYNTKREQIEDFYCVKTEDYELKVRYNDLAFDMLQMQIDIAKKKFKSIQKSKNNEQKI